MTEWRRLDPLMLLVHPVTEVGRFFPVLLAAVVFGSTGDGDRWWTLLGVVIPVLIGVARFATTTYRLGEDRIELRRGLLNKTVLTARLDRVRSVELTSSVVHRVLGLAKVWVGTGATGEDKFELDALRTPVARELREALLRRAGEAPEGAPVATVPARVPLCRFDPGWVRYAPFTSVGLVIAGALVAGAAQVAEAVGGEPGVDVDPRQLGAVLLVVLAAGLLVGYLVLSVIGYAVTYGGYVLSTDASGRELHVVRGLLTRRESTLESRRVRGVELRSPLPLRMVGGRQLHAAVTGLESGTGGTSLLVPPAPEAVVTGVGAGVLRDQALTMPLLPHGAAARRRRFTRALATFGLPPAILAVALGEPLLWLLPVALLAIAVLVARDRYRRLGHELTDRLLVAQEGTFLGRRVALERTGIIGWTISQGFWQRRAGLCDLVATTSAGAQHYRVADVPLATAVALADEAVPGLVSQFRREPPTPQPSDVRPRLD